MENHMWNGPRLPIIQRTLQTTALRAISNPTKQIKRVASQIVRGYEIA